ncbi:undecaprenyl-diphosphate phosphatase [bacterium]|nr:undecaprenyl-diphosphate phosphatase [bacterium]
MNFIQAILMGIVQGLSEFLPISSSAHLVFTSNFYKVFKGLEIVQESNEEIFFDIMLHFGTLIAILIFFRKEIMEILTSLFNSIKTKDFSDKNSKLGLYILLGTVITVAVALPMEKIAEKLVYSPAIVGLLLIITGFTLFYSEHRSKQVASKEVVDLKTSIFIAIAQGLAALPGFSRSGWTIATGLFCGLDRLIAARYSFLLSIPIILGASMVYPFFKIDLHEAMTYNWNAIWLGTLVSGLVGYLCIKYFLKFVAKFSLAIFGYYCVIVGCLTAIFFSVFA